MKIVLASLMVLVPCLVFAKNPGRLPANSEDLRALSCTVDFKSKSRLTWHRTQEAGWILPIKKGRKELNSLGDVKILMIRDTKNGEALFHLKITQKNKSLGEVHVGHSGFEFVAPVQVHIDDGEDGWDLDRVKVTCDSTMAMG